MDSVKNEVYGYGFSIILILIAIEVAISFIGKKSLYQSDDTWGSLGLLLGNVIVNFSVQGSVLLFSLALYEFRMFEIEALLPTWLVWALTLIAIDFTFYWYHRCSHRSRFLWAIHMNHHCSTQMNFVVAFRQAWLGPISKIPFFMFLPLIGFNPVTTLVAGVISTLWGVLGHTQIVSRLGPIEWIFNTPSHHRVHHGTNPEYIDKNYGNFLIIWDRIFGTFQREKAPVVFGLVNNLETQNPFKITMIGWQTLFSDMAIAFNKKGGQGWKDAFKHFFMPPDWRSDNKDTPAD